MATPRITGTLQPVRTRLSTRFDPLKGFIVTQEYESAGDNLNGLALDFRNIGVEYQLESNDKRSRLVATSTGPAAGFGVQSTSTWQLYTNENQKDIREHPSAIALGPGVLWQIEANVNDLKNAGDRAGALFAYYMALPFYDGTDAGRLISLMAHGVTSYNVSGYAARATINLPFAYAGAIPGVSPDSLMAAIISDIPVGGPNDATAFKWGWRRMGTSRTFSGDNRTEITLEWWLASWSLFLYSDVTDLPA